MNTLKAEKRDMSVKAKRLRREGYVTGNLFGREIEGSIPLKMQEREVERLLKTSNKGSQVSLEVDGQSYDALIKEISYNTLKGQVLELDFQALVKGEKVRSVAAVVLLNSEKVVTGILQQRLEEISYTALPSALVDKVEIDVADMKLGDEICVKDLAIASDPGLELHTDRDAVVVTVTRAHNMQEEPEEAPAEDADKDAKGEAKPEEKKA
ncbi:MAG: 50S ribosomal protein L25 [Eubacteriales bacterium]|nr:50S ribosomal protein L25 [Eubacteriales bacterium]